MPDGGVSAFRPGLVALGLLAPVVGLVLVGCAGRRISDGVYHSSKGYRVRIPGPDWSVVEASRADLELRHRGGGAGMLVNADCAGNAARRSPGVLTRQLVIGLRDRTVVARDEIAVDGRPGTRTVLEARGAQTGPVFRIETLTVADARCVYDLIYAAPVDLFDDHHGDFDRLVGSFTME